WSGGAELGAMPEAEPVAGAVSGGAGLSGLGAGDEAAQPAVSSTPGAGETAAAVAGMPMMPMAPGMGAQGAGAANGASGERSDSSGLLEEATTPWTGAGEVGAEAGTAPVAGTPTGGAALSGTAATGPAMPVPVLPLPLASASRGGAEGGRPGAGRASDDTTASSEILGGSRAIWSSDDTTGTETPPVHAPSASARPAAVSAGVPAPSAVQTPGETGAGKEEAEATTTRAVTESATQRGATNVVPDEAVVAVPLPELPDDRVPVPARSEAGEDTSTWDVAGAGFGMLMAAFASQGATGDGNQESTSGYATAAPAVWEAEGTSTVRAAERTVDPNTASFAEPELTTWRPAARSAATPQVPAAASLDPDVQIRCGNGEGEVPDEPEAEVTGTGADSEREEDEEDKGMVDLLTQNASTWGTRPVVPDSIG
ncbi:hypothetical protein ACFCZ7_30630, partial [Streptomyces bauhiniae]